MDRANADVSRNDATLATCINEAVYAGELTRGKRYQIIEARDDKVRVEADNQRLRWYPASCFNLMGEDVPTMVSMTIKETLEYPAESSVEVDVELSNGQKRWCFFVTPDMLKTISQRQWPNGTLHMYGAPHMIVVSAITEAVIKQALETIDAQNELLSCTLPIP